jgi:hypothetical protein
MESWLICGDRQGRKVSIKVCQKTCKMTGECKEFQEIEAKKTIKIDNTPPTQPPSKGKVSKEAMSVSKKGIEKGKEGIFDPEIVEDLGKDEKISYPSNQNTLKPVLIPDGRAGELLSRALQIRTEIEVKFLEMGQVLDEIFSNRFYIDLGYPTQQDFCAEALDIKWRTATYLRNVYLWQTRLEIPKKKVAEIGWSKAAQILPVSKTKKDAMEWIEKAKEPGMTTQALNTKVRIARGKLTEEEAKVLPTKVLLSLYPDQKEIWDRAIKVGKKVTGSENIGYIVTGAICPEFLATYPDDEEILSKVQFVSRALKNFETAYKVKVLGDIMDQETGEIWMGRGE